MFDRLFLCLAAANLSVTDLTRDILLRAACSMLKSGAGEVSVRSDEFEGRLYSRFEWFFIGSASGIDFWAELETDRGQGRMRFLVHPRAASAVDMPGFTGEWSEVPNPARAILN